VSKTNAFETALLQYVFNATAFSWAAVTDLYVSLHTADPGEAGDQTTSEANYTGYARVAVARSGAGWTVSGNSVVNAAIVLFGADTVTNNTCTYVGVGTASAGAGNLLYKALITTPAAGIIVNPGDTPQIDAGALSVTED
jgi:hypothetical protein